MTGKQHVFKKKIWSYYEKNRRSFPWREKPTAYRVIVSEIMLQQTQAQRVVPKFNQFLRRFPNWKSLARASVGDVLREWQGLGYNRRALALKKIATLIQKKYRGRMSKSISVEELESFPGIGHATACAIAAFVWQKPNVFIETNIRSVYLHEFFSNRSEVHDDQLLPLIKHTLDQQNPRDWYYALMDYGVMLKQTRVNPSRQSKHHAKQSRFKGSRRYVRGQILKQLQSETLSLVELVERLNVSHGLAAEITSELTREGFLKQRTSKKTSRFSLR